VRQTAGATPGERRPQERTVAGREDETMPAGDPHRRPGSVDDATVAAVGKVSEGLEWLVRARGRLYDFHQMIGRADLILGEAAEELDEAGHGSLSELLRTEVVGRNVLEGRWTFQIVEEFDRLYFDPADAAERRVRDELMGGRRHVFEAEMKEDRRTHGRPGHEPRP
jgi:hypothetical protein